MMLLPLELTGNNSVGFTEDDIEGDFDPSHYDRAMERVFDESYYEGEGEGEGDEKKPVFSDDSEPGESCDNHVRQNFS